MRRPTRRGIVRFYQVCLVATLPCLSCGGAKPVPDAGPPAQDSGPAQCTIAAVTYASDAGNPANPCQSCQPILSSNGWSNLALGTACAAGAICAEGTCFAGCAVDGVFYTPDSVNHAAACQSCQPQNSTSAWSPLTSPIGEGCDGGDQQCVQGVCQAGCQIDGALVPPGTVDPQDGCRVCAPQSNRTDWSLADDGTACGTGEVCGGGTCQAGCFIYGDLVAIGALDPANPCASCQPRLATGAFSASSGLPTGPGCPAGQVCSSGSCTAGCFIDGTNVAAGRRASDAGAGACCSPLQSVTAWTAALQPGAALPTGSGPIQVVLADFNGDGVPDLATANRADSTVSIFLSTADGGYADPLILPVGTSPVAIAASDLNGDRLPDLVTANADDQTVSVLLNAGTLGSVTTFAAAQAYGTLGRPSALAIADLDGDHRPDIAVTNLDQGTVALLFATGSGTFGGAIPIVVGNLPQALVATDLDGDGQSDLAVVNLGDDNLDVLRNTGNGVFAAPVPYPVGVHPTALATNDLNSDGKPDLVVASAGDQTLGVLLNLGSGTFGPRTVVAIGLAAHSLALADFDGDGLPDIAVADYVGGRAGVLINQGKGQFAAPYYVAVGGGYSAFALATGDLDHDGSTDVAVTGLDSASVQVLRNVCQ